MDFMIVILAITVFFCGDRSTVSFLKCLTRPEKYTFVTDGDENVTFAH